MDLNCPYATNNSYCRLLKKLAMQYLNKEIEALTKKKKSASLVKREISCGVFQDVENLPQKDLEAHP